jgi:hypothetical protein
MRITSITWREHVVERLRRKYGVQPHEVEEVLTNARQFRLVDKGHRKGDDVYAAIGRTAAGRPLIVLFALAGGRHAPNEPKGGVPLTEEEWALILGAVNNGGEFYSRCDADDVPSYERTSGYWEAHDLARRCDQAGPAEFDVDLRACATLYAVERGLSERLRSVAAKQGVSAETLLNLWVRERTASECDPA